MSPEEFQQKVLRWFMLHGRKNLPWQQNITPYRVWVSEIMLQQTQVATVIPYFNKFIARYPDVISLAEASLDEVLSYWSGLGYYARARNMHKAARLIAEAGNNFPADLETMISLPGIGRSTAGAVLSIAYQQRQPILDGNVKRVLTRFFGINGWPGDPQVNRELWALSERYTASLQVADYTQAMMDLGATVCTRTQPKCHACPLQIGCYASQQQQTHVLPSPKPKQKIPAKNIFFLALVVNSEIFLYKRQPTGIWGGLWSLPEFTSKPALLSWCEINNYPVLEHHCLPQLRHTFSHYHLDYISVIVESEGSKNKVMEAGQAVWYKHSETISLGLPAPIKRLLLTLEIGHD